MGFTEFQWVLPSCFTMLTWFYRVLPSFTEEFDSGTVEPACVSRRNEPTRQSDSNEFPQIPQRPNTLT